MHDCLLSTHEWLSLVIISSLERKREHPMGILHRRNDLADSTCRTKQLYIYAHIWQHSIVDCQICELVKRALGQLVDLASIATLAWTLTLTHSIITAPTYSHNRKTWGNYENGREKTINLLRTHLPPNFRCSQFECCWVAGSWLLRIRWVFWMKFSRLSLLGK